MDFAGASNPNMQVAYLDCICTSMFTSVCQCLPHEISWLGFTYLTSTAMRQKEAIMVLNAMVPLTKGAPICSSSSFFMHSTAHEVDMSPPS